MEEFSIGFWNSGKLQNESNDTFGCSVDGFANHFEWKNPDDSKATYWPKKIRGVVLTGYFSTVLKSLQNLQFTPKACIAVVKDTNYIDSFIRKYANYMPGIPLLGGGAAMAPGHNAGEILPQGKEVSLLAISEGNYVFESMNIYDKSEISVEVERLSDRIFAKLRVLPEVKWQNALDFYKDQQKSRGIEKNNFELMTFFDNDNRNIHCSIHGDAIKCGANIPDDNILHMGATSCGEAERKLAGFVSGKNSLIFGCAGIRSLIKNPIFTGENSLAGFMFGELYTTNGKPFFGNLMLTKLTIV